MLRKLFPAAWHVPITRGQRSGQSWRRFEGVGFVLAVSLFGASACTPDQARDGDATSEQSVWSSERSVPSEQSVLSTTQTSSTMSDDRFDVSAQELNSLLFGDGSDLGAGTLMEEDESDIAECMQAAGFEYIVEKPIEPAPDKSQPTVDDARELGYGVLILGPAPETESSIEIRNNLTYTESLGAAERAAWERAFSGDPALNGVDPNSCLGQHQERQQSKWDRIGMKEELLEQVFDDYMSSINTDDAVIKARASWVECMRAEGYDYASREEILDYLYKIEESNGGNPPTTAQQEEERALAVADFGCSASETEAVETAAERARLVILDRYAAK